MCRSVCILVLKETRIYQTRIHTHPDSHCHTHLSRLSQLKSQNRLASARFPSADTGTLHFLLVYKTLWRFEVCWIIRKTLPALSPYLLISPSDRP